MAQVLASDPVVAASNPPQSTIDATFTGFLKYKPPFDEPTLELKYEIEYCLSDIINTFKSITFDDLETLPQQLRDLIRFSKRKCTFSEKSKLTKDEFNGNKNGHLCEVLKFDVRLLPLLPGFDPKEYENKMKQKEEEEKKKSESEKVAKSGWGSWTSISSWKEWGSNMMDAEAWSSSLNSWMEYFNMSMDAKEIWKIDWKQHKAVSFVSNITMSWTVAVHEYAEMEQIMHIATDDKKDDKIKVAFIKKLYVHPIVPMPQFAMDLLKEQYTKDSETQVQLIKHLIEKPLTKNNQNDNLQQLDDV